MVAIRYAERLELSDPARGTLDLQPQRDGRVRMQRNDAPILSQLKHFPGRCQQLALLAGDATITGQ